MLHKILKVIVVIPVAVSLVHLEVNPAAKGVFLLALSYIRRMRSVLLIVSPLNDIIGSSSP